MVALGILISYDRDEVPEEGVKSFDMAAKEEYNKDSFTLCNNDEQFFIARHIAQMILTPPNPLEELKALHAGGKGPDGVRLKRLFTSKDEVDRFIQEMEDFDEADFETEFTDIARLTPLNDDIPDPSTEH